MVSSPYAYASSSQLEPKGSPIREDSLDMRREGYEFQVSPPRVLYQEIDGKTYEPVERLVVDVPGDSVGAVIEKLGQRKADMLEMTPVGARMEI